MELMIEAKSAARSLNNISKILDRLNGPRRGTRDLGSLLMRLNRSD